MQVKAIRIWAEVEGRSLQPSDVEWFLVDVMPESEGRDNAFRLFCDRARYYDWNLIGDWRCDHAGASRRGCYRARKNEWRARFRRGLPTWILLRCAR